MIYSHSRINCFENCKQQFKFRYIDKIDLGLEGIEAFMGKRVHETLEFLYHELNNGKIPEIKELLTVYTRDWDKYWHENIRIVKEQYSVDDYKKLGEKCLLNYYHEHQPFDQPVLAIEKRVLINIDGIKIQGFIDRLDMKDGYYEIHDYKTGGSLPPQNKIDTDRQLALYQLGIQEMFDDVKDVKLVWHYLSFGKRLESKRTPKDLELLKGQIKKVVTQIETEKEYLPNKSMLCNWCDYKSICPAFEVERQKSLSGAEPDKIVDEYVELNNQAKLLKTQIIKAKERIKNFSEIHKLETIKSNSHELKLINIDKISPPSKAEIYVEFISKLKELNVYDKVVDLNVEKLSELLNEEELVAKELRPYIKNITTKKLLLKRN